jgi:hypothetical protein
LTGPLELCANGLVLHAPGVGPVVVSAPRHLSHLWLVDGAAAVAEAGVALPGSPAFAAAAAAWTLHGSLDAALAALKLCVGGARAPWWLLSSVRQYTLGLMAVCASQVDCSTLWWCSCLGTCVCVCLWACVSWRGSCRAHLRPQTVADCGVLVMQCNSTHPMFPRQHIALVVPESSPMRVRAHAAPRALLSASHRCS